MVGERRRLIVWGSNLCDANTHHAKNLPVFLAGGGYEHGRYINLRNNGDHPLCNLFLRLRQDAEVETDTFGQSTAALRWN